MAILRFGDIGQSMFDNTRVQTNLYQSSPSMLRMSATGGLDIVYTGSFSLNYSTGSIGGSISSYSVYWPDGKLKASFENMNISIATMQMYSDVVDLENMLFRGNDYFIGGAGNDTFFITTGTDTIAGNGGIDKVYTGYNSSNVNISRNGADVVVKVGTSSNATLQNVERIVYTDKATAFDLDGNAGIAAKAIGALIGNVGVQNKAVMGVALQLLDGGMTYAGLMQFALDALQIKTAEAAVDLFWYRLFGSLPSDQQAQPFVDLINSGLGAANFGVAVAELEYNAQDINLVGLQTTGLDYI